MRAQCDLKRAGQPYPRTCPVCKLGPCQKPVPPAGAYDQVLASIEVAAINLEDEAPSRERSLVQTKLDEARLWAYEARDVAARSEG